MFYISGDIHGCVADVIYFCERNELKADDTIILLGDVGLNYYGNDKGDKKSKIALNNCGVKIFCIHGNHEMRPETISTYKVVERYNNLVYIEDEYPNIAFAIDGNIYDIEGHQTIVIGGAYSVDKYYRLARNAQWFEDEQPSAQIKQKVETVLSKLNWKVDLVLSHTCPAKYIPTECFLPMVDQSTVDSSTEKWLDTIEDKLQYKKWYCGHWHIEKKIDKMRFMMHDYEQIERK